MRLTEKLILFSKKFSHSSVLLSNDYEDVNGEFEILAAFGAKRIISSINELRDSIVKRNSWLFGHIGYDLKNELECLDSKGIEKFDFGLIEFFEPEVLIQQKRDSNKVEFYLNDGISNEVLKSFFKEKVFELKEFPILTPRFSKEKYLKSILYLKDEIQYGNIYEINFCQEFYKEDVDFDPYDGFLKLQTKSRTPFSAFYKSENDFVLCSSPERYVRRKGQRVISQPIKGTSKRGSSKKEDNQFRVDLRADLKEQTENVMIVDLVRNDLSKVAQKGTVEVDELFGVYTFPQVHQLISTVSCKIQKDKNVVDLIEASFPMGSMTGAPKISAMKLIDKYEAGRREMYSGSLGYINPDGDFDFNVVIRSLLYSEKSKYLSLTVGGAITSMSNPEKEYDECLLKAKAIFDNN